MKAFDVVEDIRPRFCSGVILTPVDALPLEQTEEAFRGRIVRNFMDEHYKIQSFDRSRGLGIILDAYADPRTYGITATLAF